EYASPEEQRSRIQQPDVTEALSAGVAPAEPAPPADSIVAATPVDGPLAPAAAKPVSRANRLITIMLLAFGAANVVFSLFSYLDLAPSIERTMEVMGIPGEFSNFEGARTWGMIAAIVMVAIYALTAVITWRVLKAG